MSALDLGLVLFLLVSAMMGVASGFLRGALGLLGGAAALTLASVALPHASAYVPTWLPGAHFGAGWGVLVVAWFVGPRVAMMFAPAPPSGGRSGWDRGLGWIPGLAWGGLGTGVFLWLYAALGGGLPADSPLATSLLGLTRPSLEALSERVVGVGAPVVAAPAAGALELQMLGLVNAERLKAKLPVLRWDGRLAQVARAHSLDMIAKNYFAHEDPQGKTVGDRLQRAGLRVLATGENLAFSPSLAVAHDGLMKSPGHKANLLRPAFGRLGIGIVRLQAGSTYAPVVNGKPSPHSPAGVDGHVVITQVFAN